MADDLDDFFAKKDKKGKSKKKGKITNVQLAKTLEGEANEEKVEKKKKEKPEVNVAEENTEERPKEKEEEWAEFEEEPEVDLTGLKIQKLEISESGNDDDDNQGSGEERLEGGDENNPWKVAQEAKITPEPEEEPEEKVMKPPPPPEPVQQGPKKYVAPHVRQQQQQEVLRPKIMMRGGRGKKAPDITNQDSFPSLASATQEAPQSSTGGAWRRKQEAGFETVRQGSRTVADQEPRGPKLSLGNMYSALQDS